MKRQLVYSMLAAAVLVACGKPEPKWVEPSPIPATPLPALATITPTPTPTPEPMAVPRESPPMLASRPTPSLPAFVVQPSPTPSPPAVKDADAPPRPTIQPASTPAGQLVAVDAAALVKLFRPLVGVREHPMGSNRGQEVDAYNRSADTDLGSPWCAAVAHWGYAQLGANDRPGAYSPSWYRQSRRVAQQAVRPGDVAVVYFPSMGRYAHTIACIEEAIFSAGRVVQVRTLEGNTNAQNSREGDQFARRVRSADMLTFMRWNPR